jgi:LuxR family maltose regulon positive regulatory protein
LLLQGSGPASRDELLRAEDGALWKREQRQRLPAHDLDYMALARARWEIAFGNASTSLPALDAEINAAVETARNRRALKLRVLRALALKKIGDTGAAMEEIGAVLKVASREGFIRLILDEGPAVVTLIQRYANAAQETPTLRSDPILMEYLQRLTQAMGPVDIEIEGSITVPAGAHDPLTRKEIHVLQLLAEGYSNNALAEKLFVSDSTVRTHLRSINTKVGAKSRMQAVAFARKLGVIR